MDADIFNLNINIITNHTAIKTKKEISVSNLQNERIIKDLSDSAKPDRS